MSNIKGRYLWKKSIRNGFLAGHARIQLIVKQRLGRTIQLKKLWCLRMRPKQTKQTKISRRDLIQKMKDYCKNKSKKGDTVNWNNIWNWKAWEVIPSPKCKHALQLCPDPVAGCNSLHPWMFHPGLHEKSNLEHCYGTHRTPQSIPALTHQWPGFQLPCKTMEHSEKVWCRFLGSCR